ncbi:MAG TPA: hypothetical protein VGM38_09385 [Pseudolysinimonas sp.]|jgi:hypothetical protein
MRFWQRQYMPVTLPAIRAGEIDGRYIDLTSDLGAVGDYIPSLSNVSIAIIRRDGFPMTSDDLALAGSDWPNTLDATGLIVTIGLAPPAAAAGVGYQLTLTVNKTLQSRLFIRDLDINVLAAMG